MKKLVFSIIGLMLSLPVMLPAHAKDDALMMPIAAAMESADAKEKLGDSIKFYFGKQNHPKVITKLGTDSTNKKTNGFNKGPERACNLAFLSAMIQMKNRAEQLGANAIVNIVSYYKKNEVTSTTEFECHDGGLITGVALKGDFVKIAGK
ncbi:MAG TPA: excinuclease ATPase subunit [Burkholderiaceae bacterium]|jgi:uncharacterized protein YbjQ (UPF0145 family)